MCSDIKSLQTCSSPLWLFSVSHIKFLDQRVCISPPWDPAKKETAKKINKSSNSYFLINKDISLEI